MGIVISFKGKLNNPSLIYSFCNELSDIANDMNWQYEILDEDYCKPNTAYIDNDNSKYNIKGHLPLKGICIPIHPDSEPLSFYFDKNGNIRNIISMVERENEENTSDHYEFVKTQYAPIDVHITIIKILKYVKEKYISNLYVRDEGEYWETKNKNILLEKIKFLKQKIDEVGNIISDIDNNSNQSLENKIENILINKLNKKYNNIHIKKIED